VVTPKERMGLDKWVIIAVTEAGGQDNEGTTVNERSDFFWDSGCAD